MESNLAMPYATKSSPPATTELAFYSPNSTDLLFDQTEEVVLYCHAGLRSTDLTWTLHRNLFAKPFASGQAEARADNTYVIRIPTAKLYPGFYDVRVELHPGDGNKIKGVCTFGYRVSQMTVRETRPKDFEAFWQRAKDELAKIPLDAMTGPVEHFAGKQIDAYNLAHAALPGDYDPKNHNHDKVEACKVSFTSAGGLRVHGWLAKPEGTGPFPAMLVLPGAGVNARPMPLEHARHGYVAMDIQVHGLDVDLPSYPQMPGYYEPDIIYAPIEDHYYYRVYLHCLQAFKYLASRPDVDPNRIVVVGGSQGGRLSIVTAALEPRVAAIVPAIAHYGYQVYSRWASSANHAKPLVDNGMGSALPPIPSDSDASHCIPYYDIINFAQDVKCPVYMNSGLVDSISSPTGVFAVYQHLGSKDKQITPLPGMGHDWSAEFDRRAWRWLDAHLTPGQKQK